MLNKLHLKTVIAIFVCFISFSGFIHASETPKEELIKTYHKDVTGDGHEETISLYGSPLSDDSDYFREIWTIINFPNETKTKITYEGGYDPTLSFIDINQNSSYDIWFSSIINQKEDIPNHQLHMIKQNEASVITLPTQNHINGSYQEQFKVEVQISPIEDPEVIDVTEKTEKYIDSGIYDDKGNLLKNISPHPSSTVKYEPVFLSSSKGYGLKSFQRINGMNKSDKLGVIETLWYYEDKWIILQSKFKATTK